ncbi:MAG: putative Na+/H+ antiporter [Bdellovibrionaceae bacterium]|nr:putative Na+/H+ antiporter [Pseudobdellovibrionaceae bacterium]
MNPTTLQLLGTITFGLAVLHTFCVSYFKKIAHHYPEGSIGENFFHLLSEVEAVFGIWSAFFLVGYSLLEGFAQYNEEHHVIGGALHYLEAQNFTEPAFVFVIMCMASTRPVILLAEKAIMLVSRLLPLPRKSAFYCAALFGGPLLGSFITEPAAMTVTAMILLDYFYSKKMSKRFMYATVGLLFVNVSIGGTLTHFAAPPVLMVAGKYHWGMMHMFQHFGIKAMIAIIISTGVTAFVFREELKGDLKVGEKHTNTLMPTWWMYLIHVLFLAGVVATAHHMVFFMGLFLFFLGFVAVTTEYQDEVKLKESLLVAFFLSGLIVLGGMQAWWLQDVLTAMGDIALYFGATALTAITDNAALTYLGSLVELSESAKFNLVAGAVTGGGLTVIANAPNPAGYGILKGHFEDGDINPLYLFVGALFPTLVAICCFMLFPA